MGESKQVFNMPDGSSLTVVVLDQPVFDACVDGLTGVYNVLSEGRMRPEGIKSIKDSGQIPLIGRGEKTEWLFERFGIDGDKMSMIVRGVGRKMLRGAAERN